MISMTDEMFGNIAISSQCFSYSRKDIGVISHVLFKLMK